MGQDSWACFNGRVEIREHRLAAGTAPAERDPILRGQLPDALPALAERMGPDSLREIVLLPEQRCIEPRAESAQQRRGTEA
jgi:hypothetical protein